MLGDTFLNDLYNVTSYSYNDFHKMEVIEYFCIPVFDIREPSSYQVVTDVVVPFFGAHFTPDDRVAWTSNIDLTGESSMYYFCRFTPEFVRYIRSSNANQKQLEDELYKLDCMCFFHVESFEKFIRERCPVVFGRMISFMFEKMKGEEDGAEYR